VKATRSGPAPGRAARIRGSRAAFAVACAIYALQAVPSPQRAEACEHPAELRARAGHTLAVRCGAPDAAPPLRGPARRLFGLRVDPNRADLRTLETLPGIGPARAAAIVRAREERPFSTLEDLLRVSGVGRMTLTRVEPLLGIERGPGAPLQEKR